MSAALSLDELDERAKKIRVLAFDVDGVATDGRLFYGSVPGGVGCAFHAFHARDGLGLVRAREAGLVLAAISGRSSPNVEARLSELKVPHIRQGVWKKAAELKAILDGAGADWGACCFVGDDVNDLPCLRRAGLAAAPRDAVKEVRDAVHWVSDYDGGHGVLRDLVEVILRAQGKWSTDDEPLP
jgi:3-deoxy-D-manno-octulosonate 8-phosphate phosphatase (KDO 8-P phosphatase)